MGSSRWSTLGLRPIAKKRGLPEISARGRCRSFQVGSARHVENCRTGLENTIRSTAQRAEFVTFTQQLLAFYRQPSNSPKKAAFATVFGLPRLCVTGLNLAA